MKQAMPRPRRLEPEEEDELDLLEEIDAKFYGYSSAEEKRAHEQQMIDDLRQMELEEERKRELRALNGWDDEWDLGEW